jgi:hypothetical protein
VSAPFLRLHAFLTKYLKALVFCPLRYIRKQFVQYYPSIGGAYRLVVHHEREVAFSAGRAIGAATFSPSKSIIPPLGFWSVPNGRILGDRGVVCAGYRWIDNNGNLRPHLAELRSTFARVRRLSGTTAMLVFEVGRRNYYHFLVDLLPKLDLVRRSEANIDHYVAPLNAGYQREAYQLLGIADKVVPATPKTNIICDRLLVTDDLTIHHTSVTPHFIWEQVDCQLDWGVHFIAGQL